MVSTVPFGMMFFLSCVVVFLLTGFSGLVIIQDRLTRQPHGRSQLEFGANSGFWKYAELRTNALVGGYNLPL